MKVRANEQLEPKWRRTMSATTLPQFPTRPPWECRIVRGDAIVTSIVTILVQQLQPPESINAHPPSVGLCLWFQEVDCLFSLLSDWRKCEWSSSWMPLIANRDNSGDQNRVTPSSIRRHQQGANAVRYHSYSQPYIYRQRLRE